MISTQPRRAWIGLIVVISLLAIPQIASAASWSSQEMPAPKGQRPAASNDISCYEEFQCMAVGYISTVSSENGHVYPHQLVDTWNGTGWSTLSVPEPAEAVSSELRGVTCSGKYFCVAVGHYEVKVGNITRAVQLAEFWNGFSWSTAPFETVSGAIVTTLNAVDCPQFGECVAVGQYTTEKGIELPLTESWSGSKWGIDPAAVPSGTKGVHLYDVSCGSQPGCMAVGDYEQPSGLWQPFAEVRNAPYSKQWWELRPQPLGNSESFGSEITGVWCRISGVCTLAGTTYDGGAPRPLIASWRQGEGSMVLEEIPVGPTIKNLWLSGISCVGSTTECFVVGKAETTSGKAGTFVPVGYERQTLAKGWVTSNPSLPGAGSGALSSISCQTMVRCMATGAFTAEATGEQNPLAARFQ